MYIYIYIYIYIYSYDAFLWLELLKIIKNGYTWEWVRFFSLRFKKLAQRAANYTASLWFQLQFSTNVAKLPLKQNRKNKKQ